MAIVFHENTGEFHLYNEHLSYMIKILDNGQLGNLYYGKRLRDRDTFGHLLEGGLKSLAAYVFENDYYFSLQHTKQEYPSYGTTDFRYPAFEIKQENGSAISHFQYESHVIYKGKKKLKGLPATYVEQDSEAVSLEIILYDSVLHSRLVLSYTIYEELPVITRNAKFINHGEQQIRLTRALSAAVDLPDYDFESVHLAGAWSRERHVKYRKLEQGVQSIHSLRGASSAEFNPFLALKRPQADEFAGEVYGFSLVYSGNFLAQVEVDTHHMTRVTLGIHPDHFEWPLQAGETFQTPEAVLVYSNTGLNGMSQAFHRLYRTRLARGKWRDQVRPILINNWEATSFDFDESKVLSIASTAKELGIEMFVLDDGWFGARNNDRAGLGDWYVNREKLPDGIEGLAKKIEALGMKFGLWFEPEMVNKDSDLYRAHPDWIIHTPGRAASPSRNQYVLDYSRKEVVDYIYGLMSNLLRESSISYVKWDMNRYITECYSTAMEASEQGKVFHRYILGVYDLYERLTSEFPNVLFESCSSGGARFDPGILYYAPQTWTSDNTDAIERIKIQYGTSYVYPVSSMGAHVSEVPNQQIGRITSLQTRANVAYFGAFGYELDLNVLHMDEREVVKRQVQFAKKHREFIQQGVFYRLMDPFKGNVAAWIVVSENKSEALAGYYQVLNGVNLEWRRLKLAGLDEQKRYCVNGDQDRIHYGDELMNAGLVIDHRKLCASDADFASILFYLNEV
ncbi:alpha-galactosidase [Paenibacillus sp. NEAU-GSW1]|uniref:alpha-galactosidase n=1 Tax=Paenibacillus sp. NEAU-GSW1 TaxID=2682486 RepID=UPI0012E1F39E|nr:alpha-galactosidase [Paenibacillus sp. NEAU-GSW1]MUT68258.1 alpha-galactosidase [Paenibacillus sp. NEAU-GSW1]